jgi:hypothetical protein
MIVCDPVLLTSALFSRREFVQLLGGTASALAFAPSLTVQRPTSLANNQRRLLDCLGTGPGRNRRLDGNTVAGSVSLQPVQPKLLTGMWWRVVHIGDNAVAFECQGDQQGNRWLDGNTTTGVVGLAPHTREPFSGTRWQPVQIGNDRTIFGLRCLGRVQTERKWLDGNTMTGAVTLASTTDPPFTGTRWRATGLID